MNRCAVIGLGKAGFQYDYPIKLKETYSHSKAFLELDNTELISASDIDNHEIDFFKSIYKVPVYNSHLDMLDSENIDIVSICTPNDTHINILEDLLNFKIKCIICEKPISNDIKNVLETLNKFKDKKIPVFVNYFRRWDKLINELNKEILNKQYGELLEIDINYSKGLIHSGTHYLDFLINFLGAPNYWTKPIIIENLNNMDFTTSFKIDLINNEKITKVNMNGFKEEKDEIIYNFINKKIKIINSRDIFFYNIEDNFQNPYFAKKTNFSFIIKEVIKDISLKIDNCNYSEICDNSYESYKTLWYAKKINESVRIK